MIPECCIIRTICFIQLQKKTLQLSAKIIFASVEPSLHASPHRRDACRVGPSVSSSACARSAPCSSSSPTTTTTSRVVIAVIPSTQWPQPSPTQPGEQDSTHSGRALTLCLSLRSAASDAVGPLGRLPFLSSSSSLLRFLSGRASPSASSASSPSLSAAGSVLLFSRSERLVRLPQADTRSGQRFLNTLCSTGRVGSQGRCNKTDWHVRTNLVQSQCLQHAVSVLEQQVSNALAHQSACVADDTQALDVVVAVW
jgi:hypothetical protein